jgi:hypothetical protein
MDERGREEMDPAIALLEKVAPEFGVAFADNHKATNAIIKVPISALPLEILLIRKISLSDVKRVYHDILCLLFGRISKSITFSDPAESTYMAWYALAAGFDGALRWAFNSWVKDPLHDSRFRTWPAGDTILFIHKEEALSVMSVCWKVFKIIPKSAFLKQSWRSQKIKLT